jgi:oxygen-independent coproporphyrinogen III oxidase
VAGIYLHIPFCSKACHYCDFHFSTNLSLKDEVLNAMLAEIGMRSGYLDETVDTIYFGGGTPSLLSGDEIKLLINTCVRRFTVAQDAEITLEANPDDLSGEKLKELKAAGINRLSIGIQSFNDGDLIFMNRAHTSAQALKCVHDAKQIGFNNISVDLIFALPGRDLSWLKENIEKFIALDIQHVSCYGLTIEPRTALADMVRKGKVIPAPDKEFTEQYSFLITSLQQAGFIHYEISNFAKPGYISKHNSSYWKGASYLGIGPSAHSFNGDSRRWNIRSNHAYVKALNEGTSFFEEEELTETDKVNEYLLTTLRTHWGVDLDTLVELAGDRYSEIMNEAKPYLDNAALQIDQNRLLLTDKGKLICDRITSDLFITNVRTDQS